MKTMGFLLSISILCVTTAAAQQTGFVPFQSYDVYDLSDFDAVNTSLGTVQLHIPIISYSQRGSLPTFGLEFTYNTPSWVLTHISGSTGGDNGADPYSYYLWTFSNPNHSQLINTPSYTLSAEPDTLNPPSTGGDYYINLAVDSSGASHAMYGVYGTGALYESIDGSGIMLNAGQITTQGAPVIDRNGITYNGYCCMPWPTSDAVYMQDPAGNQVTARVAGGFTDSVGRSIPTFSNQGSWYGGPGCETQNFPAVNGTAAPIRICWQSYTAQSDFQQQGTEDGKASFVAISSLTLPNGAGWSFTYDSWGFLSTVTTPTGAVVTYTYEVPGYGNGTRLLQSRTVEVNGASQQWTYAYSEGTSSQLPQTTVTDPMGDTIIHSGSGGYDFSVQYIDAELGLLKTVQYVYAGLPTMLLEKTLTIFPNSQVSEICTIFDNNLNTTCTGSDAPNPSGAKYFDPNSQQTNPGGPVTTWPLIYGSQLYSYTYDFGTNGSPGPLLKQVSNTYLWQTSGAYLQRNFLNQISSTTISSGGSNLASTSYGYDESNGSPGGVLGNQTSASRWLSTSGDTLKSQVVYNIQGMPVSATDPKGYATAITYDSTGMYPAQITRPQTGNVGHLDQYAYDFSTGLLLSHTDENLQKTTYGYDTMRRQTSATYPPGGGQETYFYNDTPPNPQFTYTKAISADATYVEIGIADAMGRKVHTEITSDPFGADYTDTTYDGLGRIQSVSNPYRTQLDATYALKTTSHDVLGRPGKIVNQDNTTETFSYSGNAVTFTNEVGNQWRRTSDALGRLSVVLEPSGSSSLPAMETDYGYDALGNLVSVKQKGQSQNSSGATTRSFTYDSLSRLISASNPETGTIGYAYDANGNVQAKTDARGVLTNYSYDPLNRLISKTYSNDPSNTPSSCYQYDTRIGGSNDQYSGGRLALEWTQKGACPGANGIQNQIPYMAITGTAFVNHDAMGRIVGDLQATPTKVTTHLNFAYGYDLAGDETYVGNPVGAAGNMLYLNTSFDGAAHMNTLTSSWGTYPTNLYTVGQGGYGPVGPLSWSLGTSLSVSENYTKRLQVSNITVAGQTP